MQSIVLNTGSRQSTIHVGGSMADLESLAPVERMVVITDPNVWQHHRSRFPDCPVIRIGVGEGSKTLETVAAVYERLIDLQVDRAAFLVGVGGGLVCDVCGFVASTYLRGIRFGFVATTLLAQVDASVGGKNGINFMGYKNMVGVFNQPEFVICDLPSLHTLPRHELQNGLAEAVKHGAICDRGYFEFMEQHAPALLDLEKTAMTRLVADSVRIKAAVVKSDEKEAGPRRVLNFGHTLGHALEKTLQISHGQAVSAGMVFAARLSVRKHRLAAQAADRLERLLERLGLPTVYALSGREVADAIRRDKKRQQDSIHFVLLEAIGRAVVDRMSLAELEGWIHTRESDIQ